MLTLARTLITQPVVTITSTVNALKALVKALLVLVRTLRGLVKTLRVLVSPLLGVEAVTAGKEKVGFVDKPAPKALGLFISAPADGAGAAPLSAVLAVLAARAGYALPPAIRGAGGGGVAPLDDAEPNGAKRHVDEYELADHTATMPEMPADFSPALFWTEALKFLAGLVSAFILGYLAHRWGWIGQKKWDTAKYQYELFKDHQSQRIQTLKEMQAVMRDLDSKYMQLYSAKSIGARLKEQQLNNPFAGHTEFERAKTLVKEIAPLHIKLEALSYQYGRSSGHVYTPVLLPTLVRPWIANFQALFQLPGLLEQERDRKIERHRLQMVVTIDDLREEEEKYLLDTPPGEAVKVFRNDRMLLLGPTLLKRVAEEKKTTSVRSRWLKLIRVLRGQR